MQALIRRNADLGSQVVLDDAQIDELEQLTGAQVVRLLALRQPMASDLREIVAALKIASDLERIGDYSANIGKRVVALSQVPPFRLPATLPRMGWLAQQNIRETSSPPMPSAMPTRPSAPGRPMRSWTRPTAACSASS